MVKRRAVDWRVWLELAAVLLLVWLFATAQAQNGRNYLNGTLTIASGATAMGTSAISSGSCASTVTVAATGVGTTDVIIYTPNATPTAITGYGASATGADLTVYAYPTSGDVNFAICNSTASSITPSAITLNWRVVR
jgi:hypothetical protein